MRKLCLGVAALALTSAAHAQTGRQLQVLGDPFPTTIPSAGDVLAFPIIDTRWDTRCASVSYVFNSSAPANAGTPVEIDPQTLADTVQTGHDRWNDNPSSFIEFNVTDVEPLGVRPAPGGDFVNETNFVSNFTAELGLPPGVLAFSASTALTADATFVAGDDIDGDGDADVFDPDAEGVNVCTDIDGDGDNDFPAGDYPAGTIVDNDVQFNQEIVWELTPTIAGGADVDAVSTHEFGHSHSISHATINQISDEDGTGSTMFPSIDTTDPNDEFGVRSLHTDDLAASAFIYQEGTEATGIAALQPGDIAFSRAFDLISGEVVDADGTLIPSANVQATNRDGEIVAETYAGENITLFATLDGFLILAPETLSDAGYEIPVPRGGLYKVGLQALDGLPVAANQVNTQGNFIDFFGLFDFPEEFYNGFLEDSAEIRPGQAFPVFSRFSRDIDFDANVETIQRNTGPSTSVGFNLVGLTSVLFAEQFDRDEVLALINDGNIPVSGLFQTNTLDASFVVQFGDATLSLGTVDAVTGDVTLTKTLARADDFVGQPAELSPFYFPLPRLLPFIIKKELEDDPDLQLFLTLDAGDLTNIGPSGLQIPFLAFNGANASATSFLSLDGGPLAPFPVDWSIELRYVNDGGFVSRLLTKY